MASATTYTECSRCRARIVWAASPNGGRLPLDWQPDNQGVVAASCDHLGRWTARPETPGVQLTFPEKRYACHWDTSPECKGAETAQEPPAGVAQIDAWREGVSGHSARQRAGRGRGRQPGITGSGGYRAWPGGQR